MWLLRFRGLNVLFLCSCSLTSLLLLLLLLSAVTHFRLFFFSLAVSAAVWIYRQYADADGWLLPAGGLLAPLAQLAAAPLMFSIGQDLHGNLLGVSIGPMLMVWCVTPPTGFTLNNTIYQLLVARYSDPSMTIDFDNFVGCLMRLEMMFSE